MADASHGRRAGEERPTGWPTPSSAWGCAPGDRVAYVAQNHLEYVVLEFALLKAGLVKVPLNPRFTPARAPALHRARRRAPGRGRRRTPRRRSTRCSPDDGPLRAVIGARDGWTSFADAGRGRRPTPASGAGRPRRPLPHPVQLGLDRQAEGHRDLPARRAGGDAGQHVGDEHQRPVAAPRTLQVAPLVYAGGWSVLPTLLWGGTNVVAARFDADEMLASDRGRGHHWMFAVPTMLRRMSTLGESAAVAGRRSLACLMLAGEPAAIPALEVVSEHTDAHGAVLGPDRGARLDDVPQPRARCGSPELWTSIGGRSRRRVLRARRRRGRSTDLSPASTASW